LALVRALLCSPHMRPTLAFVLLIAGCGSRAVPISSCHDLDEATCRKNGCQPRLCAICEAPSVYSGCYDTDEQVPVCTGGVACTLPCAMANEAVCLDRPECRADYCNPCNSSPAFAGCVRKGAPPTLCADGACPTVCRQQLDLTSCQAHPECHAVFQPAGACGCAGSGCCTFFSTCADGPAICVGTALCSVPPPDCEGPYVLSYAGSCYEGCVLASECQR